jgi:heterotetrameric sarcosine oxidase gamma subunit
MAEAPHIDAIPGMLVASLRYFESGGAFAASVEEIVGAALPAALRISFASTGADTLLAWRSPTESLLLCRDAERFAALARSLAVAADGCMVDQTGGLCVLEVHGAQADDLLLRLGSSESVPGVGEARSCRLAELAVLVACRQASRYILVVERVYLDHLLGWIRATSSDL